MKYILNKCQKSVLKCLCYKSSKEGKSAIKVRLFELLCKLKDVEIIQVDTTSGKFPHAKVGSPKISFSNCVVHTILVCKVGITTP